MAIPGFVLEDLDRLELELAADQLERLDAYLAMLLETNQRMNLTAIRDADTAWRRMIVDSLTVLPGVDDLGTGAHAIDVGSGGGLPGVPLAIAKPELSVTLLEATGKKAAFLEGVAEALSLANVSVLNRRAEAAGRDAAHRQCYDAVVCRAVGPMPVLLEYGLPLLKVGGRLLAMKGPKAETELDVSGDALATLGGGDVAVIEAYPESFGNDLVVVSVVKDRPTPKAYPRMEGLPKKQPL